VARGQWVDPALGRITFAAFVDQWKAALRGLRDSSLDRVLGVVDNHLLPGFGQAQLARITYSDVQAMVADDMLAGYSGSSVRRHVIVLRGILETARRDGRVGRNVAEGVKLPPESARPMRFLDADQLADAAGALTEHYRPLVLTAGWVGLRWANSPASRSAASTCCGTQSPLTGSSRRWPGGCATGHRRRRWACARSRSPRI
jgi:hypothetical protein